MELLNFGFGKKLRSVKKSSKATRKPPARLLKICKKYHIKATKKVGSKRMYKSVKVLKKLCLKKAMAHRKKLMIKHKVSARRSYRLTHRKSRFGSMVPEWAKVPAFGRRRRSGFGNLELAEERKQQAAKQMGEFYYNYHTECAKRGGNPGPVCKVKGMGFGKKTGRKVAMKAFRSFYKRHCAGRRSGFGSGGNPPLYQSMGGEFCPNGMGGVLGANSTGLFPTPCVSARGASSSYGRRRRRSMAMEFGRRRRMSKSMAPRRMSKSMAPRRMSKSMAPRRRRSSEMEFGLRRVAKRVTKRTRRYNVARSPCNSLKKHVCWSNPNCSYTIRGCKRRYGTATKGVVFEGPALQFGRLHRRRRSMSMY